MNQKIVVTAVFLLSLCLIAACTPDGGEPEQADRIPTRLPKPTESPPTPAPPLLELPLNPDEAPSVLPIYTITLDPIPDNEASALAWAQAFGLVNGVVATNNEEVIRILSLNERGDFFEELTFRRGESGGAIVYSSGIYWQNSGGPTPLPTPESRLGLSPEVVTGAALSFVREHNLLPEPVIAHEIPSNREHFAVFVSLALEGLRVADFGQEPGVTVWIDGDGRVVEAQIVSASLVAVELKAVQPFYQLYAEFMQGVLGRTLDNERVHRSQLQLDPMRFHAYSLPFGEVGERVELVYAPLPTERERLVPMWLITRPDDESWDHYVEYYLSAIEDYNVYPQLEPTPTPSTQTAQTLLFVPPILVDEEDGRLYADVYIGGQGFQIASMDAATGEILQVFDYRGRLALDAGRNLLFVDTDDLGELIVIDTTTGMVVNRLTTPSGESGHYDLQADPATGNVLLFRNEVMLIADALSESWQETTDFWVEENLCGEEGFERSYIRDTWFDQTAQLLYLRFLDDVCGDVNASTVVVYNMYTMREVTRHTVLGNMYGLAVNGRFYGRSWSAMGVTQWVWENGRPTFKYTEQENEYVYTSVGFVVDENRGWLYEITRNGDLQIFDTETMALLGTVAVPVGTQLGGFDPVTDNLYLVEEDGGLLVWPAESMEN